MRRALAALAITLTVLSTSACTGSGIEAFDREQTTADRLSDATLETLQVEPGSTRFLAEDDGAAFFAATSDEAGTCLVVIPEEDSAGAFSTCSPGALSDWACPGFTCS